MKYIIQKLLDYRDSIALSLFYFGAPTVYFLRDGVGLAPNSMIFTVLLLVGPMFLVFPFRSFKKLYEPNGITYTLGLLFLFFSAFYLIYYPYNRSATSKMVYELSVIGIIIYIYVLLTTVSIENLEKYFLQTAIFFSLIGSLALLYYVFKNPTFVVGSQRASISFNSKDKSATGNPHIFAKGAFFGLIACFIFFKKSTIKLHQIISVVSGFIFVAVLFLTQAMSAIISSALFLMFYFIFNLNIKSTAKSILTLIKKWYVLVFLLFIGYKAINYYQSHKAIIDTGTRYIEMRVNNLIETFLPSNKKKELNSYGPTRDDSANTRVKMVSIVKETFYKNYEDQKYHKLFFGNGYMALYVDVPILEVIHSFGLVGFIMFCLFFFMLAKYSFDEMRNPSTYITEFIAYGFIYFFVYTFTNGLIIDYNRWGYYALVCRFIPLSFTYLNSVKVSTTKFDS